MARKLITGFALLFIAATFVHAAPSKVAPGRILVKGAAGLSQEKLDKILEKSNGKALRKLRGSEVRVVQVPEKAEAAIARALSKHKNIAFAEPDMLVEPIAVVNDPDYGRQWHLPLIGAPSAWPYGDGTGVTVAVLDTGVYPNHPDLSGRVLSGWNTVSNNSDTADINNHGTWVAGVVAAKANNLIGGASTAPGAKILPIRITNSSDGWAYFSDMVEGITWAADHGARVANLSYGGAAGSQAVADAASYMMSKGGVVVVAAGNDNTDYGYGNYPSLFVAGATTSSDAKAGYSSHGAFVDIAAPGSGIYTTNRSGGYSTVQGTSFASPNAAAVAALVMAANSSLNPTDVTAIIINTAQDLGTQGWDPDYGHGRVNALAAAQLAYDSVTSDTTPPNAQIVNPGQGAEVSGDVGITVQASDGFGVERVELLVDGNPVATETFGGSDNQVLSYVFSWDSTSVDDNEHQLKARAYDHAGNMGPSTVVAVNVLNDTSVDDIAPVISSLSPNGGTYSSRVTVSAQAADNKAVTRIDVRGDGKLLCSSTSSSASCSWNLRKLSNGPHTVTATAFDAAGNSGDASSTFTKGSTSTDDGSNGKKGKGRGKK